MKILSENDLKKKKIIIINNLSYNKIDQEIILKLKKIDSDDLVIFLKEVADQKLLKKFNCRVFTWSIFRDSVKKRFSSHRSSKRYLNKNKILKKKKILNLLNDFFKTEINHLQYAIEKENMILLQKKFEIKNIENEIKKYNKNVFIFDNTQNKSHLLQHLNLIFYYLCYPIYSLFFFKFKKNSKNIKIALRTYNSGIRLDKNDLKLDWFVEKNKYKKNTVFFCEDKLDKDFRKQIKKNNYDFVETFYNKPYYFLSLKYIFYFYPKLIIKILLNLFQFLNFDLNNKKVVINGIKNYILWNNICSLFELKIFFSYHDISINSIYRNIILNSKNCKTISFKHSHSELVHDEKNYLNIDFVNNFFFKEYHWSKIGIKNAKRNLSRSDKLHNVLPFCKLIDQKVKKIHKNKKLFYVTCFSSQLGTSYSFNNIKEHLFFLKYMNTLIKHNKNLHILFKPKYKINLLKKYYPKHYFLIKELIQTKRFSIHKKIKAVDLIKQSSFSISMSFSSPTIEALSLLKPSFYVSFQNSFKNNSFRKMKFFYANSFDSCIKNFNYWKNSSIKDKLKSKLLKKYFNQIFGYNYYSYDKIYDDLKKYLD